jgi:hypothetical protein
MESLKAAIKGTLLPITRTYPLSVLNIGQEVGIYPPFSVFGNLYKILLLGERPVQAPIGGLVSNYNYFFDDGGTVLTGVSVTVTFTADFTSSSNGFSFKLNCYSKDTTTSGVATWQQYVIGANPNSTQLYAQIDNWTGTVPAKTVQELIRPGYVLTTTSGFSASEYGYHQSRLSAKNHLEHRQHWQCYGRYLHGNRRDWNPVRHANDPHRRPGSMSLSDATKPAAAAGVRALRRSGVPVLDFTQPQQDDQYVDYNHRMVLL